MVEGIKLLETSLRSRSEEMCMNVDFRGNDLYTEEEISGEKRWKFMCQESVFHDHFCGLEEIHSQTPIIR